MHNLKLLRSQRTEFLLRLYEWTKGDEQVMVSVASVARDVGLATDEARRITQYLMGEGCLRVEPGLGSRAAGTAARERDEGDNAVHAFHGAHVLVRDGVQVSITHVGVLRAEAELGW